MASPFTSTEISARITALKAELVAVDTDITNASEIQQYTVDTGQTRISAMRAQVSQLESRRERILSQIYWWQQQLDGSGSAYFKPST